MAKIPANPAGGITYAVLGGLGIILGAILLSSSPDGYVAAAIFGFPGIVLVAFACVIFYTLTPSYAVRISTSGGEVDALVSKDEEYIDGVVTALTSAIVKRG